MGSRQGSVTALGDWCNGGGAEVRLSDVARSSGMIRCRRCGRRLHVRTDNWCPISAPAYRVPAHKQRAKRARRPSRAARPVRGSRR